VISYDVINENIFTSKQAAEITGCPPPVAVLARKGVVVPVEANRKGTERLLPDLVTLAAMEYCLSVGLSFDVARETVKTLKEKELSF